MPCSQRRFQNRHCGGPRFHPYMMFPHLHPFFTADNDEEEVNPLDLVQKNKTTWNESEDTYIFSMDVPGVKAHQITIEEKDGEMEIAAVRMKNDSEIEKTYQEVLYVSPSRADLVNTVATLDDGVLTVIVPKKSNEPVDIETKAAPAPAPAADGKEFRTSMDLPGVKAVDLKAQAREGKVSIEATRNIGDRVMAMRRTVEVQPASSDVSRAHGYLQDGVYTLVVPPVEEEEEMEDSKPSGMRTIWVTSTDTNEEVPAALASLCLDEKEDGLKEAMVVETVTEDKDEWEQVDGEAKKPAFAGKKD